MEASLLVSLQLKLDDLEANIRTHREVLLQDFHRHCYHLLEDVSADVASSVRRAIVRSFVHYPHLRPDLECQGDSQLQRPADCLSNSGPHHQPPSDPLDHFRLPGAGVDSDPLLSPLAGGDTGREREDHLRGLFTPSYLPLLEGASPPRSTTSSSSRDSSAITMRASSASETRAAVVAAASSFSSSSSPSMAPTDHISAALEDSPSTAISSVSTTATTITTSSITGGERIDDGDLYPLSTADGSETKPETALVLTDKFLEQPCDATPMTPQTAVDFGLPPAVEGTMRGPDESPSSVCSDKSDSKTRKSALRRSSSLSKTPQSPRRVRFDVSGAEVLPTASPQASSLPAFSGVTLPELDDESISLNNILDGDLTIPVAPPKISSSEALRALSRRPLEAGTIWTVVNPVLEEENETEPEQQQQQQSQHFRQEHQYEFQKSLTRPGDAMEASTASKAASSSGSSIEQGGEYRGVPLEELGVAVDDDSSSSDENDYLTMYNLRSSKNPPNPGPMQSEPQEPNEAPPAAAMPVTHQRAPSETMVTQEKGHVASDDDDDDDDAEDMEMFDLEPCDLGASPKPPRRKPRQLPPLDSDSDDEPDKAASSSRKKAGQESPSASPSAVAISDPPRRGSDVTPANRSQPATIGSYKGRPVVMPVVKDPGVYALAASLGNINTFVGGLDGRSGIDEGDLHSFRHSVITPSIMGEPRSFTERLMMEDAQAKMRQERPPLLAKVEEARTPRRKDGARREKTRRESQGKKAKETPLAGGSKAEAAQLETVGRRADSAAP